MNSFKIHNLESAPEDSYKTLSDVKKNFGFIPNLLGELANAPSALKGYLQVSELFSNSSLNSTEQQIVLLTVSFENQCDYCMAAHSKIAKGEKVPQSIISALRDGSKIEDAKLEALRNFTRTLLNKGGWVSEKDLEDLFSAGYTHSHVLEIILGVALKTISNYTNHVATTPLDKAFEAEAWFHPDTEKKIVAG